MTNEQRQETITAETACEMLQRAGVPYTSVDVFDGKITIATERGTLRARFFDGAEVDAIGPIVRALAETCGKNLDGSPMTERYFARDFNDRGLGVRYVRQIWQGGEWVNAEGEG